MLLALIVWIGGIIFFAFVLAPTLFHVLPTTKLAGDVVSVSLTKLHWLGLVSGFVFLLCSLLYNWRKHARLKPFAVSNILIVLMLVLTSASQFGITPAIRQARSQLDLSDRTLTADEVRETQAAMQARFQHLHVWSTRLEGTVLFLGLGVVVLAARRFEVHR
jgi:hypothetical protein